MNYDPNFIVYNILRLCFVMSEGIVNSVYV